MSIICTLFQSFTLLTLKTLLDTHRQSNNDLSKDAQVLTLRPCEFNFVWKRKLYRHTFIEDLEILHVR